MLHGAFSKEAFAVATEGLSSEDPKYKKLMKSVLDDDEIQALALYLMRCVDPDRAKHKLEGTELGIEDIAGKSVNLNDFIGIFTEDNMDIATMHDHHANLAGRPGGRGEEKLPTPPLSTSRSRRRTPTPPCETEFDCCLDPCIPGIPGTC